MSVIMPLADRTADGGIMTLGYMFLFFKLCICLQTLVKDGVFGKVDTTVAVLKKASGS